mgnify:FL=1
MNVILLTRRRQAPLHLLQIKFITLFVLGLSLLVGASGYVGYRAGIAGWADEAAAQRSALSQITQSTVQGLDALTSRIGELQSHVIRLDALGQRLTEVANLDSGEFDFQDPPAQGGPDDRKGVE